MNERASQREGKFHHCIDQNGALGTNFFSSDELKMKKWNLILVFHSPIPSHSLTSAKVFGGELGYSRLIIMIFTHLRTEYINQLVKVSSETQNKLRFPSKTIMDTLCTGWLQCGQAIRQRGVCHLTSPGASCSMMFFSIGSAWLWPRWFLNILVLCWRARPGKCDSEPEFWKLSTRWHQIFVKSFKDLVFLCS